MTFDPNLSLSSFVTGRVSDLIAERRTTWEKVARAAGPICQGIEDGRQRNGPTSA
jgi:hypothetical protein